jgi:hypothetical protein
MKSWWLPTVRPREGTSGSDHLDPAPSEDAGSQISKEGDTFSKKVRWYLKGPYVEYTVDGDGVATIEELELRGDTIEATLDGPYGPGNSYRYSRCSVSVPNITADGSMGLEPTIHKLDNVSHAIETLTEDRGFMTWGGAVDMLALPSVRGVIKGRAEHLITYGMGQRSK